MSAPRSDSESSPKCQQILHAAADLFTTLGYGAVSMDAIAKAAGVSKATLYAYFTSKDRLFETIISEACEAKANYRSILPEPSEGAPGDLRSELREIGCHTLRFMLQDAVMAIHRVVIAESPRFPELGRAFYEGGPVHARSRLSEWMAQQRDAGRLFITDPAEAADQWMSLLRGDLYIRGSLGLLPKPTAAEIDAAVDRALELFLRGYARPPTTEYQQDEQRAPAAA